MGNPVNVCLACGGELEKIHSMEYRCVVCRESYEPEEAGFPLDAPPNIYRGERLGKDVDKSAR